MLSKTYSRLASPAYASGVTVETYRREALDAARRSVDLSPSLYDAHVALALAARESGELEQCRAEARRAIDLNPRLAEGYAVLGDTYSATPFWGCARDRATALADDYYRKALEIDPRLWTAHSNRIGSLRWGGRPADALRAADQARQILPPNRATSGASAPRPLSTSTCSTRRKPSCAR